MSFPNILFTDKRESACNNDDLPLEFSPITIVIGLISISENSLIAFIFLQPNFLIIYFYLNILNIF